MSDAAPQGLLVGIGLVFLGGALSRVLDQPSRRPETRVVMATLVGFALLVAAVMWGRIQALAPALASTLTAIASDARVWLALLLLGWIYLAVTNVILLRQRYQLADVVENDMIPFRRILERYVLPRELDEEQLAIITRHLRANPPSTTHIVWGAFDFEAGVLRSQLRAAIDAGAWRVVDAPTQEQLEPGIHLDFLVTRATNERLNDRRQTTALRVLTDALQAAQVQMGRSGTTFRAELLEDKLTLTIGPRPFERKGRWKT